MGVSLTEAVQTAIYENLTNGVTGAPAYSVVPQTTPPIAPPYVVIDSDVISDAGGKGSDFERHEVRILSIAAPGSKPVLLRLMQQVKEALKDQPLTFAGADLSAPVMLAASDFIDAETGLLVGDQTFLVFAQPD